MLFAVRPAEFTPQCSLAVVLCASSQRILVLRRTLGRHPHHLWDCPTEEIRPEETPSLAAQRALALHVGLASDAVHLRPSRTYYEVEGCIHRVLHMFVASLQESVVRLNQRLPTETRWCAIVEALDLPLPPHLAMALYNQRAELFPRRATPIPEIEQVLRDEARGLSRSGPALVPPSWWTGFGPPGGGKTTGLSALAAETGVGVVTCDEVLTDGTRLNRLLKRGFSGDNRGVLFLFQMEVLPLRLFKALFISGPLLIDESIYSALAYSRALYEMGWIDEDEYAVFFRHYLISSCLLPPPRSLFFFDCPVSMLLDRIQRRLDLDPRRAHERAYDAPYLHALREAFTRTAIEISSSTSVVHIDTAVESPPAIVRSFSNMINWDSDKCTRR